jgi:hypothetical protein
MLSRMSVRKKRRNCWKDTARKLSFTKLNWHKDDKERNNSDNSDCRIAILYGIYDMGEGSRGKHFDVRSDGTFQIKGSVGGVC